MDFRDDFSDFADLCFKEFGDRVKHWITLNEPHSYSTSGYSEGNGAPGRCSKYKNQACQAGDSSKEPYLAGYHQLLAHAAAVEVYKRKYQVSCLELYIVRMNHKLASLFALLCLTKLYMKRVGESKGCDWNNIKFSLVRPLFQ